MQHNTTIGFKMINMTDYKVYGTKGNEIVSGKTWKEAKQKVKVGKILQIDTLDDANTISKLFWGN